MDDLIVFAFDILEDMLAPTLVNTVVDRNNTGVVRMVNYYFLDEMKSLMRPVLSLKRPELVLPPFEDDGILISFNVEHHHLQMNYRQCL